MPIDAPYFVRDPLLDIPQFPAPGWFAGAQLQVVKPTLFNHLGQVGQYTQKGTRTSTSVQLPSAHSIGPFPPTCFWVTAFPPGLAISRSLTGTWQPWAAWASEVLRMGPLS